MKTAIVIPSHKQKLQTTEELSFRQCCKILGKWDIILATGNSTNCSCYTRIVPNLQIQRFDDSYFASARGYNELMLTPAFYERFIEYDYILIYQLDAWVFRDELQYWVSRNYDYIGAPFATSEYEYNGEMVVGNGGLSLRNVRSFIRVLKNRNAPIYGKKRLLFFMKNHLTSGKYYRLIIPLLRMIGICNHRGDYFNKMFKQEYFAEDLVLRELSDIYHHDGLKYAPFDEAIHFSWEHDGERFRTQYGVLLPFACHAWEIIPNPILHEEIKKQMDQLLTDETKPF